MNFVKKINSLAEIINSYDLFIIDQWGVIHNGQQGYPHAIECINKLYNLKKKLIIISNSSKRKSITIERLPDLGFQKNIFAEVMTSGEIIWQELNSKSNATLKNFGENCYHLYDKHKKDYLIYEENLNYNFVDDIDKADFILGCTLNSNFTALDYVPLLEKAVKKKLPFICANPDFETIESSKGKKIICMGTIAQLYEDFGGLVFSLGKPSIEIYKKATKKFKEIKKNKILAIGDSIHHDIRGAINFGIDSLLITSGIHKSIFDNNNLSWNENSIELSKFNFKPTFLCSKFQF